MANSMKKSLPILCLMLLVVRLGADAPKRSQRIEWRSNANALEYKVEIQNTATKETSSFTTEKTFAELSLSPGDYRYRVTAYDFLGRPAAPSAWTAFLVIQAAQPEIRNIEKKVTAQNAGKRLEIAVDIANVSANSVVELVSESVQGELGIGRKGGEDETGRVSKVYFEDVPPGKWRLRVTNASGFSVESDVIEVMGNGNAAESVTPVVAQADEAERVAREVAEQAAREAAEREAAERAAREAEERAAAEQAAREAVEREAAERAAREAAERAAREAEELAKRQAEEQKAAEKAAKKAARQKYREEHPYIIKDITFAGGIGAVLMPYDGTVKDTTGNGSAFAFMGRFSAFPVKQEKQRFGFELLGRYADFGTEEEYYTVDLSFVQLGANFVWKHTLFGPKSFFAVKGGGGLVIVNYATTYLKSADGRENPERKRLVYPALTAGASLIFNPANFLSVEAGADFSHLFITGMPTGCITPYICVGLRL